MRYLVTFKDKTTKRISQKEGEAAVLAKAEAKNFILRGAAYDHYEVASVKPINKDHFNKEFVEMETRKELNNPDELAYLQSISSPQLQSANS